MRSFPHVFLHKASQMSLANHRLEFNHASLVNSLTNKHDETSCMNHGTIFFGTNPIIVVQKDLTYGRT